MNNTLRLSIYALLLSCVSVSSEAQQIITTIAGNGSVGYSGDGGAAISAQLNHPHGVATDGANNIYISDDANNVIRKISNTGIITTVAGTGVAGYNGDNMAATAAKLNAPFTVAVDGAGNIYIPDASNHRIRKVSTSGMITTIAGTGTAGVIGDGGAATAAQLNTPGGIALDAAGNIYIGEINNHRIRKIDAAGMISTFAGTGTPSYFGDGGAATSAWLHSPNYVHTDAIGNVYISDNGNHRIRKVDVSGIITTIAGTGVGGFNADAIPATASEVFFPGGMANDASGNFYIADYSNTRLRQINTFGIINTICGSPVFGYSGDGGPATAANLNNVVDVTLDNNGNIIIADYNNNRIRRIGSNRAPVFTKGSSVDIYVPLSYSSYPVNLQLAVIDTDNGQTEAWNIVTPAVHGIVAGSYSTTSTGLTLFPTGISYTPTSGYLGSDSFRVSVTDPYGGTDTITIYAHIITIPAPYNIITTIAGTGTAGYSGDGGLATAAKLYNPGGIAFDASGNAYIAEFTNNVVRKVSTAGTITTFAGTGLAGNSGEGVAATSGQLSGPTNLAFDAAGNLYICSFNGNVVRMVSAGGIITTFAGNGVGGFTADNVQATATKLFHPSGVAVDAAGNVFISDYSNSRVRKVDVSGIITTVVGTGVAGSTGDGGPAIIARINQTFGITLDRYGNLYLSDASNNKVREVTTDGFIKTIAGTGAPGFAGDGLLAQLAELHNPTGTAVDTFGNIYIADQINNKVRKIDITGIMTTVAGSGATGFNGDGCLAIATAFNQINGVAIDPNGNLHICDNANHRVREIVINHPPFILNGHSQSDTTCEGVADTINSLVTAQDTDKNGSLTWNVLAAPLHGTVVASYALFSFGLPITPTGVYYTPAPGYSGLDSFTIRVRDCTGQYDSTTIHMMVNPAPHAGAISGPSNICTPNTVTLSETATGGTWSSAMPAIATIGSTGLATGVSAGSTVIDYTVTNSCGTDIATYPVTVNAMPVITATITPTALCANDTLHLSSTPSGGSGAYTSFSWSGPGGYTSSLQNTTYNGAPVSASGVYSVTVTDANGCTSLASTTLPVTVHPLPIVTAAASNPICATTTITLTATPGSGSGTYTSFTWVGPNSFSASTRITTIPNIALINEGVYSVTVTDDNGCTTAAAAVTPSLVVNPLPSTISSTTTVVCVGASITLEDPDAGGKWSSSNTSIATVDSVSGEVTGVSSILIPNITYTLPTGCATSIPVTVNLSPAPISGTPSVCEGAFTTLTDIPTGGTWSSSSPLVASISPGGPGIGIISGHTFGSTVITYTLPNGCMTNAYFNVNLLPTPIGGPTNSCLDATIPLADLSPGGTWTSSNNFIATVDFFGGVVTGVTAGSARITYTLPTGCFTTIPITFQITPPPIAGPRRVCVGAVATLSDSYPGGTWSSADPASATVTAGVSSTTVVTGVGEGFPVISYTLPSGCSALAMITVNPLPVMPAPIMGSSTLCAGGATMLIDITPGGVWSSSNMTVASVSGGLVAGFSAGTTTISYTAVNSCGSVAATKSLIVNPLPVMPAAITGPASVCPGSAILLTDPSFGGVWSSSNTTLATVTTLGFVTGASGGVVTISYTKSNSCGDASATKLITVNPTPAVGGITGVTGLCAGTTTVLTDLVPGGTWVSSSLATATIGTSSGVVTGLEGGTSTITYTVTNVCGSAFIITVITVNPLPPVPAVITGTPTLCIGTNTSLIEIIGGGVWSSSNTFVATVDTIGTVYGVDTGTSTITYTETNGCGTTYAYRDVTVNTLPVAGSIAGTPSVCKGSSVTLTNPVAGGVWSGSDNMVAMVDSSLITGVNGGTVKISYTTTNYCGSTTVTTNFTVNNLPFAGLISGKTSVCPNDTIILSNTVGGGAWSIGNSTLAHITGAGIVTGVVQGQDTAIYTVTNSCGTAKAMWPVTILSDFVCRAQAPMIVKDAFAGLKVYPNPNNGSFSVLLSSGADEQVQLVITNIVGEKIMEYNTVSNRDTDIKLNVAPGVYFISAVTENGRYVARVTIE